ncbi:AEC family transporter [Enterococcus devriesei]|uniref:Auxin efflux carrier n=1 Tax=Enterococcus devriesei TaxID=319970 RepID=A0A1L8SSK0_9ENTE|nr:AEC family transporter [Enterococcus devriesei]MBU5365440.1 AEC family transporter [Enterococcus devriesei]MDT2822535.1 AEC family transporter [Enterococcus devriesei]OJG34824.1 auxin efflux carrier [Enterococcus devriesei]
MIFFQSIQSVLSIIIMIALGYILKGQGWFDESFGKSISSLITRVALPASIFVSVLKNLTKESLFQLSGSLIYPVGAVIISYILAYALVKILKIQPGRRGIFMNAVVNANTIFIGLPLNIALFGEKSLPYFLVYYVTNTVSTWAFGVFLISNDDPTKVKGENKAKLNWKKLLPPPLLGFIVAILFLLIGIPVPGFINATLGYVGSIVTPLSLLYIGIVLHDAGLKSIRFDRDTVVALLGRFVLAPAVLIALITIGSKTFGADLAPLLKQTLIVQSATPMLAVLPILANEAHGDVKYATNLVTTSTILFVVVVPILMQLVQFI